MVMIAPIDWSLKFMIHRHFPVCSCFSSCTFVFFVSFVMSS